MAVAVWDYTLCPNCGKDHGYLDWVTGWCKFCTIKTRRASRECLVCFEPIFAQRKDARFCSSCKKYKTIYRDAITRRGQTPEQATKYVREMYKEDIYDVA